jgi:vacuolar protein sorting-associated protein 11
VSAVPFSKSGIWRSQTRTARRCYYAPSKCRRAIGRIRCALPYVLFTLLCAYSSPQVSSVALSASLAFLAIGLGDGTVLLYRHLDQSILSGSASLSAIPKHRTVHESPAEPVTALGFREPTDETPAMYLFIATTNRVLVYQATGRGSGGVASEVHEAGAALGCAVMDWKARDMVVARDEAIYICGAESRGSSYAYEG